jgi:hypothetical protein
MDVIGISAILIHALYRKKCTENKATHVLACLVESLVEPPFVPVLGYFSA